MKPGAVFLLLLVGCFDPDLSDVHLRCYGDGRDKDCPTYDKFACRGAEPARQSLGWCLLPWEQVPSSADAGTATAPDMSSPTVLNPWALTLVSATLATSNGGMPWDPGSAPDPFAVIDNKRTPTVQDTLAPQWNYRMVFSQDQLTQAGIGVQFFDDDGATNDKMSQPRTVKFTQGDLNSGVAQFMNWDSVLSVTFTLQRQ